MKVKGKCKGMKRESVSKHMSAKMRAVRSGKLPHPPTKRSKKDKLKQRVKNKLKQMKKSE